MSPDQRSMLFGLFNTLMVQKGIHGKAERDHERQQITVGIFGKPVSWGGFMDFHIDRVKVVLMRMVNGADLDSALEEVRYEEHDAAQAAHVPVPAPGKQQFKLGRPRTHASQYERITAKDDPGERRRLVWFISRLVSDAYATRIAGNMEGVEDWRDLSIPKLTALRDTVYNRLSAFITKVKRGEIEYHFDLPESPRPWSNRAIIYEMARRGSVIDMRRADPSFAKEQAQELPF